MENIKIKVPAPNYRLKLVVLLTDAEKRGDHHLSWLIKNEWAATVNGQKS